MDLLEGVVSRRSIRGFKPTPVPREVITKILNAASLSPSFSDSQPWEVVVVSGSKKNELSKNLRELGKADVVTNPDLPFPATWTPEIEKRVKDHGARRFATLGIGREDTQKRKELTLQNLDFYGAPCALFLFMDRSLTSWSLFDIGLFAQSICLAAHSCGIGTCLQASVTNYPDVIRELLGIPKTKKLIIGIAMGYPDYEARLNDYRAARIGLDDFVQWHT